MDIYDIDTLTTDSLQGGLYDLTNLTFDLIAIGTLPYTVPTEFEMRIDLICNDIYKSTDYCDFIINLNDIDNPLNIKSGDILLYAPIDSIPYYRISTTSASDKRNTLLNNNKSNQNDSYRQKYAENNYQLPPTYLDNPSTPVSVTGTKLTIEVPR